MIGRLAYPSASGDTAPRQGGPGEIAVATVVTSSHLPVARAMARTLHAVHPSWPVFALLLDPDAAGPAPVPDDLTILSPDVAGPADLAARRRRQDAFALANGCKAALVGHLLARGWAKVVLLDADIVVVGSLDALRARLDSASFVLTPHILDPARAPEGRVPLRQLIELGAFNGGLWGVRDTPAMRAILERLDAFLAETSLPFADQRALPLAASMAGAEFAVLDDPGYNVAYWNLHERAFERTASGYTVDGRPAAFVHLSGHDPSRPLSLSRWWPDDRPLPAAMHSLLADYAELLVHVGWTAPEGEKAVPSRARGVSALPRLTRGLLRRR